MNDTEEIKELLREILKEFKAMKETLHDDVAYRKLNDIINALRDVKHATEMTPF